MRFKASLAATILLSAAYAGPARAQTSETPALEGAWSGMGSQLGPTGPGSAWAVELHFHRDGGARIEYSGFDCIGVLTRTGSRGPVTYFRERILEGDCPSRARVGVIAAPGKLFLFWDGSATRTPDLNGAAVLYPDAPVS